MKVTDGAGGICQNKWKQTISAMNLFSKSSSFLKFQQILHPRFISTTLPSPKSNRIKAWQVHSYNDPLQLTEVRAPIITHANELLIQVEAASINPLDVMMSGGYGAEVINVLRKTSGGIEFPLTLGRDFAGRIIKKGMDVPSKFKVGQQVCGVVPVHLAGSHAEQLVVQSDCVGIQPGTASSTDCASLMYAGVTAWCALWVFGGLLLNPIKGKRVLVLGASGGVGSVAVQLLKIEGAEVTVTCAPDAIPILTPYGVDHFIDYTTPEYERIIKENGEYELILDCAGHGHDVYLQNDWSCKTFVTLSTPLLANADSLGLVQGLFKTVGQFVVPNLQALSKGKGGNIRWAYFMPLEKGVKHVRKLIELGMLLPLIHCVVGFDNLPVAYDTVKAGHLRGKVVVDMVNKIDGIQKDQ